MNGLKVLVLGSGGREHALAWALARSASVSTVESAPGNPGMAEVGPVHALRLDDRDAVLALAHTCRPDLVVIGPEAPLAAGLADHLRDAGFAVFGPGAAGAELEASKATAKDFMARHGVPTARFQTVRTVDQVRAALHGWEGPVVVKASGLAAGKGVIMCATPQDAEQEAIACLTSDRFGDAGQTVVLEETLIGEEASLFVVTDGDTYRLLPGAQDHKRAFDGDRGPNTGGMGAYTPAPVLDAAMLEQVRIAVVEPTLRGLRADGLPFRGVLFIGLMFTERGPQVLEYNVRFGDPETQAVLAVYPDDLGLLLHATAQGNLAQVSPTATPQGAAVCVVAAAGDYPTRGSSGARISGVDAARATGALVFHAGTALRDGALVTCGGRVLNVVGRGADLQAALAQAYQALEAIHFDGIRYRRDIAARALARNVR